MNKRDAIRKLCLELKKGGVDMARMEREVMIKINTNLDETIEKTKRLIELLREVEQIVDSLFQNSN